MEGLETLISLNKTIKYFSGFYYNHTMFERQSAAIWVSKPGGLDSLHWWLQPRGSMSRLVRSEQFLHAFRSRPGGLGLACGLSQRDRSPCRRRSPPLPSPPSSLQLRRRLGQQQRARQKLRQLQTCWGPITQNGQFSYWVSNIA